MTSLHRPPLSQSLCQSPEVTRGDFHLRIRARRRIEDALRLDIRLPLTTRVPQRVAPGVAEGGLFAGLGTNAWHVEAQINECAGGSQTSLVVE